MDFSESDGGQTTFNGEVRALFLFSCDVRSGSVVSALTPLEFCQWGLQEQLDAHSGTRNQTQQVHRLTIASHTDAAPASSRQF